MPLPLSCWPRGSGEGAGLEPSTGDFDGDGRADLATYRPTTGEWFVTYSSTGFTTFDVVALGTPEDVPVP